MARQPYILFLSAFLLLSCNHSGTPTAPSAASESETMYQVSTLQALMEGGYDGYITVGELCRHGDFGMGTFDKIDGEMIVLDGNVYQARHDGSVALADGNLTVPFANITHFDSDFTAVLTHVDNMDALTTQLTQAITPHGLQQIYAVRIAVPESDSILVRSELPQRKPYRPLAEVLQSDQREYTYHHLAGTIVALYFPDCFVRQNATGWHCHFLSDDATKGGHMFDLTTSAGLTAHFDATPCFSLYLPQ